MKTVAKIYMDGKYFIDEANKTIGKPLIGKNAGLIIQNRRYVTSKLNEKGTLAFNKKLNDIEATHIFKIVKVKWDRNCGCSMCPCSPGFRIYGNNFVQLPYDPDEKGDKGMLYEGWIE